MSETVWINGDFRDRSEARLAALSSSALYGSGVFTTVRIISGKPFLWEKHWRRLAANAVAVGIDVSEYGAAAVEAPLYELIRRNGILNGRARITAFDESPAGIWPSGSTGRTSILIMTGELREVPADFRLTFSPYRVNSASPIAGIKSCNYLENLLALDEARSRGLNEAIRLNERREIAGGCMSNVFWVKGGRIFTPSLNTGCLPGTTREFILESLDCEEAEAVYLTSAGLGIVAAARLDERGLDTSDSLRLGRLLPAG